jgi:hypothetical protein
MAVLREELAARITATPSRPGAVTRRPSILLLHHKPLALLLIKIELRDGGGFRGPLIRCLYGPEIAGAGAAGSRRAKIVQRAGATSLHQSLTLSTHAASARSRGGQGVSQVPEQRAGASVDHFI